MKKYTRKEQPQEQQQPPADFPSDTDTNLKSPDPLKTTPSDQETGLPSMGVLRQQNNYSRPIVESQPRNQGFINTVQSSNQLNSQSRAHSQYYDSRSEQPIYVPPYLLNQRASRRHDYNRPLDYLPWSVANIFICVIIALPALFFSVQTRDLNRAGNVKKAKINSKRSLILNIVASVVGLLTILLAVILRFALYQLFVHNDVNSQNVPIIIAGGR